MHPKPMSRASHLAPQLEELELNMALKCLFQKSSKKKRPATARPRKKPMKIWLKVEIPKKNRAKMPRGSRTATIILRMTLTLSWG